MYELNPGVIDGLNSEEIKTLYPDEWEKALENPFGHRYPRGESYHDLSVRLDFFSLFLLFLRGLLTVWGF